MRHNPFRPPYYCGLFDYFKQRPQEEREQFLREVYEYMLDAHSPQEVAQKALGANSPQEVAQKALGANSPQEVAQKALGANSPEEAALELIKTKEQRRKLMARLQQMGI